MLFRAGNLLETNPCFGKDRAESAKNSPLFTTPQEGNEDSILRSSAGPVRTIYLSRALRVYRALANVSLSRDKSGHNSPFEHYKSFCQQTPFRVDSRKKTLLIDHP